MKYSWFCFSLLFAVGQNGFALTADQQAVLDAYKAPFSIYLKAVQDLSNALKTVSKPDDLVGAADRFCDQTNDFVDQFNSFRDRYANSDVVKSMNNDPDVKKNFLEILNDLKNKMKDSQPTLKLLTTNLEKYKSSSAVKRVTDRLSFTFNRMQLIGGANAQ